MQPEIIPQSLVCSRTLPVQGVSVRGQGAGDFFLFMKPILLAVSLVCLFATPLFAQPDYELIADSVYIAEGGLKASKPYGIFYKGCDWEHSDYCRQIAINTFQNNYQRWLRSDRSLSYLQFLSLRYAPLNAINDPKKLNKNWLKNVLAIKRSLENKS